MWQAPRLKRRLVRKYKEQYGDQIDALASVYCNIKFMGCRYEPEVEERVLDFSEGSDSGEDQKEAKSSSSSTPTDPRKQARVPSDPRNMSTARVPSDPRNMSARKRHNTGRQLIQVLDLQAQEMEEEKAKMRAREQAEREELVAQASSAGLTDFRAPGNRKGLGFGTSSSSSSGSATPSSARAVQHNPSTNGSASTAPPEASRSTSSSAVTPNGDLNRDKAKSSASELLRLLPAPKAL